MAMLHRDQEVFQGCGVEEYNLILTKGVTMVCAGLLKQGPFFLVPAALSSLQQELENIHTAQADGSLRHS